MGQTMFVLMVHAFLIVITAHHVPILQKENAILQQVIKSMMHIRNARVTVDTTL